MISIFRTFKKLKLIKRCRLNPLHSRARW